MHALRAFLVLLPAVAFADVLKLPPDQIAAGEALYLKKCRNCHGNEALGGNAPDIQDVLAASEGVENMPKILLTEQEAEQIAVYLMSRAPDQARRRLGAE